MKNEIGSEFWDIPQRDKKTTLFSEKTEWFLSGRVALKCIIAEVIQKYKIQTVSLPSWCCDSMILPFLDAGLKVEFYSVLGATQDLSNISTDAILLMDYFGYGGYSTLHGYNGIVIRDLTHSIFSKLYDDADYYFGSLRKWAGFFTGGFALGVDSVNAMTDYEYVELRRNAMHEKSNYIRGILEDKRYLESFEKAEKCLECYDGICGAAERDIYLAKMIDVDYIRSRRRANAKRLLEEYTDIAIFKELKESDCPMFVPIYVPSHKRDELRNYLITRRIYCPVHWPVSIHHQLNKDTEKVYKDGLSLVCDQRYTIQDMDYMISEINRFWKE